MSFGTAILPVINAALDATGVVDIGASTHVFNDVFTERVLNGGSILTLPASGTSVLTGAVGVTVKSTTSDAVLQFGDGTKSRVALTSNGLAQIRCVGDFVVKASPTGTADHNTTSHDMLKLSQSVTSLGYQASASNTGTIAIGVSASASTNRAIAIGKTALRAANKRLQLVNLR